MKDDNLQPVDARGQDPIMAVHKLLREHGIDGPLKSRRDGSTGVYVWSNTGDLPAGRAVDVLHGEGYKAGVESDPPAAADGPTVYVEATQ